jgi:murein DD-endopeptidase MepM/ murein hydrolase activator NlpD
MGQNTGPSSAGAVGLMQFEPATAQSVGINPNDPRQAIFGAAKLLTQYGYHQDPFRAIGAYNGGPGNPQSGYARQVLSEAQRLAPELGGGQAPSLPGIGGSAASTSPTFDQAAYHQDLGRYLAGNLMASSPYGGGRSSSLFSSGVLTSKQPNPANYYVAAQSNLQALAGDQPLQVHPAVAAQTKTGDIAGGFLPAGAPYQQGRRDQGRDFQTTPGGPLIAPGSGYVVRIGNDPHGFGPRYGIVHFTTGPFAGRTMYLGHTLAAVTQGSFKAGQVLAYTGTTPIGNATVPGWAEIGFADNGTPGPNGQPAPF